MNTSTPSSAAPADAADPVSPQAIAALPVSAGWKERFTLIARAGGPALPRLEALGFVDRLKARFNVLAFFFGPFYYAVKGMNRKAVVLTFLVLAAMLALNVVLHHSGLDRMRGSLIYAAMAVFAMRANIDYYKKVVLGEQGWL